MLTSVLHKNPCQCIAGECLLKNLADLPFHELVIIEIWFTGISPEGFSNKELEKSWGPLDPNNIYPNNIFGVSTPQ